MKIAIVGSREGISRLRVGQYVARLPRDTVIVSGGAPGVDTWAEEYAKALGMPEPIVIKADWKRYGKSAGYRRNPDIVAAADRVVAFWDGRSSGTWNTMELAHKAGLHVEVNPS